LYVCGRTSSCVPPLPIKSPNATVVVNRAKKDAVHVVVEGTKTLTPVPVVSAILVPVVELAPKTSPPVAVG